MGSDFSDYTDRKKFAALYHTIVSISLKYPIC